MTAEQVNQFLVEYKALCEKHLLGVSSCGCCNGIFLHPVSSDDLKRSIEGELIVNVHGDQVDQAFKNKLRSPYGRPSTGVWDQVEKGG